MKFLLPTFALAGALFVSAQNTPPSTNRAGILQLNDSSMLHGSLDSINATNGLGWRHPAAKQSLQFSLTNVHLVRFENAEPPNHNFTPTCRFQFKNGDELMGNIRGLSGD